MTSYPPSSHNTSRDLSGWSSSFCAGGCLVLQVPPAIWNLSGYKSLAEAVFLPGVSWPNELRRYAQEKQEKTRSLKEPGCFTADELLLAVSPADIISLVPCVSRVYEGEKQFGKSRKKMSSNLIYFAFAGHP